MAPHPQECDEPLPKKPCLNIMNYDVFPNPLMNVKIPELEPHYNDLISDILAMEQSIHPEPGLLQEHEQVEPIDSDSVIMTEDLIGLWDWAREYQDDEMLMLGGVTIQATKKDYGQDEDDDGYDKCKACELEQAGLFDDEELGDQFLYDAM